MDIDLSKYINTTVSDDQMTAYIYISSQTAESGTIPAESITQDDLRDFLSSRGIKAGIDKTVLQSILINKLFDRQHVIAKGQPPVNGIDGRFVLFFKTEIDNHPKVLEDGSVDYRNIDIYEPVHEGMKIAEYIPATPGHFGYNVSGSVLNCANGRELSPLKGTGFTVSDDKKSYFASLDGKIEFKNDTITVTNVLDIPGDVDLTTGDIVFNGDIIIHGNVHNGAVIKSKNNITIMGNVEGAMLYAGGEVQLKSGMQGGGKGYVEADGDIWGKFFEQTKIRCNGNLNVNSMMNCDVFCCGDITISGRHGIIVGGMTMTQGNINATVIGNMAEVKTVIAAGVNEKLVQEINGLENEIKTVKEAHSKHERILDMLKSIKNPSERDKITRMLDQVIQSMQELDHKLSGLNSELEAKLFQIQNYSKSKITVQKYLYPNVHVTLNGLHYITKDTFTNVYLTESGGQITVINDIHNK
ncbi:MAG: FapA family protein [Lachnospiraceae bacterium]|nr:FapA family protein [Lachnospiraceae bacterium]